MIYQGDCLEVMAGMEDQSVHAIVTDPPYELGFMGRAWDKSGIAYSVDLWREALRVLKPGGFLLAFGGTRTYHRMACAIEDAGFVVNPMIGWIYGSGFPKAADVGKGIDKAAGAMREVVGPNKFDGVNGKNNLNCYGNSSRPNSTAPATPAAVKWDGYKYSISPLKPALEPICMAMKPYDGKPLDSIQRHEVGAVNVKGCAVPTGDDTTTRHNSSSSSYMTGKIGEVQPKQGEYFTGSPDGRFPPNLAIDPAGAREVGEQSGESSSSSYRPPDRGGSGASLMFKHDKGEFRGFEDDGTAARFFPTFDHYDEPPFLYCAKAGRGEREAGLREAGLREAGLKGMNASPRENDGQVHNEIFCRNHHPTVKPIALMRWLIRLVTREGQTVLDPFNGSGTTGCAAALEGRSYIGIELDPEYIAISEARIKYWQEQPIQLPLFTEAR